MDDGRDRDIPDQIPEEIPTSNISHGNEYQRSCPQNQQLHLNSIHQPRSTQLPAELPTTTQANTLAFQSSSAGPGNPALLQYYEAQMRDHAAAYASAAAAAAMTAAQIAAEISSSNCTYQSHHQQLFTQHNIVPISPMLFPESRQLHQPSNVMHQNFGPPYQHQSWIHKPSQPSKGSDNCPNQAHEPSLSSEGNLNTKYHQRRRKRQQRVSSDFYSSDNNNISLEKQFGVRNHGVNREYIFNDATCTSAMNGTGTGGNRSLQGQQKRGRRRRRFWNDAGSSDSGDPSFNHSNNSNDGNYIRTFRRNRKMPKATSSSSDGGSTSWITKKKQRQPNDDSLLGKTGVSALYEWCMKRRTTPMFSMTQSVSYYDKKKNLENETEHHRREEYVETQEHAPEGEEGKRRRLELEHDFFETTVSIDDIKMGTGRGRTKTSAKHEASRRALLTLLPGVEFEEDSGILIRLPGMNLQQTSRGRMQQKIAAMTSLEDLAPNLAKQLAIGHSNDDNKNMGPKKKTGRNTGLLSRDSRKRQKWPHVYPGTSTTSDDEDENSYYASRGAYVCSSLLHAMVQIDERLVEPPEFSYQVSVMTNEAGGHSKLKRKAGVPISSTSTAVPRGSFQCTGILKIQLDSSPPCKGDTNVESVGGTGQPRERYRLLRSFGVGGTKREARHTAAAKLLAMLFPECDGMADVKQAAEAAREKYAASRALKQQSKREALFTNTSRPNHYFPTTHLNDSISWNQITARPSVNTPVFPTSIKSNFLSVLGGLLPTVPYQTDFLRKETNGIKTLIEMGVVRQLSRQQQLEDKIDWALQKLNEHDDEGRSLPEELTADDVGRTVLRRARVDDIYWVEKLFKTEVALTCATDPSPLFETVLVPENDPCTVSLRLWSSSTIVLLLCRAIAPHEDPPLGCAVLTLGFSLQKGKILRIGQIASKQHQPRERFVETLSVFAKNMECSLIISPPKSPFATLKKHGIIRLFNPSLNPKDYHLRQDGAQKPRSVHDNVKHLPPRDGSVGNTSLQAVKEEGEGVDEIGSSSSNDVKEKRREKPSKRSRFE